jgi:hypothetical protein
MMMKQWTHQLFHSNAELPAIKPTRVVSVHCLQLQGVRNTTHYKVDLGYIKVEELLYVFRRLTPKI